MDFESILQQAQKNQLHKKEPIKCLATKFKPPTKEQQKKDKALSDGVKKFLERKEKEERERKKEADKKREELTALRALDPKANKRIQTMLKRTKSANKSVMEDAVDSNNTADTLAGPSQPDEDDYGFVSDISTALYEKLLKKMYSTPSDDLPKFAPSKKPSSGNLLSTKERVKMALIKQEEEEHGPRKRKRRKKDGGDCDDDEGLDFGAPERPGDDDKKKESDKPTHRRPPAPPPMDFMELLKIAEKKQHEPVAVEQKVKKPEPSQLMTKKQREEHRKYLEWKAQRELRLKALERGETPPSVSTGKAPMKRIPKVGQTSSEQRSEVKNPKPEEKYKPVKAPEKPKLDLKSKPLERPGSSSTGSSNSQKVKPPKKLEESETDRLKRERDEALRIIKEKEAAVKMLEEKERLMRERDEALAKLKKLEEMEAKAKKKVSESKSAVPERNGLAKTNTSESQRKVLPKSSVKEAPKLPSKPSGPRPEVSKGRPETIKPREFPPKDVKPREFPPKDVKPREFPPRDLKPSGGSAKNGSRISKEEMVRKKLAALKRRKIQDSDEEYDSDLDDFIDDGPDPSCPNDEVSKVISQIFRYDKNRYSRYDDDAADECMESNWAQISKEEYYSAKCGLLEDLEDIKAEKEALARKKVKKK